MATATTLEASIPPNTTRRGPNRSAEMPRKNWAKPYATLKAMSMLLAMTGESPTAGFSRSPSLATENPLRGQKNPA